MRAFVTGATGFIGGHVASKLRERGDEVVALVRSPERAGALRDAGCELVEGDLSSADAIRRGVEGCDSAFHVGADYRVGIPASERPAMFEANVRGTERVLDSAVEAGVRRIVYVSTVNRFGNTRGRVVDEGSGPTATTSPTTTRPRCSRTSSRRTVYGPGDHSEVGNMIEQAVGLRLRAKMFPETGLMLSHVEDVAAAILLAHDWGKVGQSYVLAGERATMGELVDRVCAESGRRPPRLTMPAALIKASAPLGGVVGPALGFPPNVRELVKVPHGVTYWASDDKARRELGFAPRDLETGLRQTLTAR